MKRVILILTFIFIACVNLQSNIILIDRNLYKKEYDLKQGSFKVFEFEKTIIDIKANSDKLLDIDFIDDKKKPLKIIKVLALGQGIGNLLISFEDGTSIHLSVNIHNNMKKFNDVVKKIDKNIEIIQADNKVLLKGNIKNEKMKKEIEKIYEGAGLDIKKDLINITKVTNPNKLIRVKLHVATINNEKGLNLKNNWTLSSKNYMQVTDGDKYYNEPLNSAYPKQSQNKVNNQRIGEVNDAMNNIMKNATTLSGGLTGAANYLGKYFNAGLVLNYLAEDGVANVLDETTLLTIENKEANFLAGGTIYIKTSNTASNGNTTQTLKDIKYGLELGIKAKNIIDDKFIELELDTKSTTLDWVNQVDNIPAFKEKSIKTNVITANGSTIVLGGLISNKSSNDIKKIPILGDLPILGFLFRNKEFKEGKSELVFFVTPEIVDPKTNFQNNNLNSVKTRFERFKEEGRKENSMFFDFNKKQSLDNKVENQENSVSSKSLSAEDKFKKYFEN